MSSEHLADAVEHRFGRVRLSGPEVFKGPEAGCGLDCALLQATSGSRTEIW